MPIFDIADSLAPILSYGPATLLAVLAGWAIIVMRNAGRLIGRE